MTNAEALRKANEFQADAIVLLFDEEARLVSHTKNRTVFTLEFGGETYKVSVSEKVVVTGSWFERGEVERKFCAYLAKDCNEKDVADLAGDLEANA